MYARFKLKDSLEISDLQKVDPKLLIVLGWFVKFCGLHNLECCLTSIIAPKTPLSVSDTHPEGRAFDARTNSWKDDQIHDAIEYLEANCGQMGAILKDGTKKVAVYHDIGYGFHLHCQVFKED